MLFLANLGQKRRKISAIFPADKNYHPGLIIVSSFILASLSCLNAKMFIHKLHVLEMSSMPYFCHSLSLSLSRIWYDRFPQSIDLLCDCISCNKRDSKLRELLKVPFQPFSEQLLHSPNPIKTTTTIN